MLTSAMPQEHQDTPTPLEDLLATAFWEAFERTLPEVTNSAYYERCVSEYSCINDDLRTMQRTATSRAVDGWTRSWQLSVLTDLEELQDCSVYANVDTQTVHEYALVATLTHWLIEKAKTLIGPQAMFVARQWQRLNKDERIDALRELGDLYAAHNVAYHEAHPSSDDRTNSLGQLLYTGKEPLFTDDTPHPFETSINCLGMSLYIVAFATLAGANFVYVNRLNSSVEGMVRHEFVQAQTMRRAIEALALGSVKKLHDAFVANANQNYAEFDNIDDYHHCIAIDVGDGEWYQFDPYMQLVAELRDIHSHDGVIERMVGELRQSWHVMPGLTAVHSVRAGRDLAVGAVQSIGVFALEFAQGMLQLFGKKGLEVEGLTLEEFVKLIEDVHSATTESLQDELIALTLYTDIEDWVRVIFALDTSSPPDLEALKDLFENDASYRLHRLQDLIYMPLDLHYGATAFLTHTLQANCDETMELANPSFMPGLQVLSHLRAWSEVGNRLQAIRLARLSTSQLLWNEAVQQDFAEDSGYLCRAGDILTSLSVERLHPRVQLTLMELNLLDSNRNETA